MRPEPAAMNRCVLEKLTFIASGLDLTFRRKVIEAYAQQQQQQQQYFVLLYFVLL